MDSKVYTYEEADPHAHSRAYEESVLDACRALRHEKRAKTHARVAKIPTFVIHAWGVTTGLITTVTSAVTWGASAAFLLASTATMTAIYIATNDVRISIVRKDPAWRQRHPIISRIVGRHPLDVD
ncbi:hypothetical protein [Streptomyces lincolnensis]|uniref:hypothetical protein n=1 Tax=Streptomyces lincolnensis TaxID=1915 RepID=UPI0037D5522E